METTRTGSRKHLVVSLLTLGMAFAVGAGAVELGRPTSILGTMAAIIGIIAALSRLFGEHSPRQQRWASLVAMTMFAGMLGLLTGMVLRGVLGRWG
jgi:hypothetical protein